MSIQLFEHNQKAYVSAAAMLAEKGKAAIIHPTGTGKSFIGFKLCEDNPDKTICWLSPSDYIFKTQLENLSDVSNGWNPKNIKFYTYARLMMMSEIEMREIKPDILIADEYHRLGAEQWGSAFQKFLKIYNDIPMLGLSATNIRYLDNQRDMAEELFEGNIASEMTLGEAVVRNILPSPIYVTALYTYENNFEKYEHRVQRIKNSDIREQGEQCLEKLRRAIEKADGLDEIFRKHIKNKNSKYIVFCANREHMDEMISHVPEWFGKIDNKPHIYSAYSADPETSKAFAEFKEDSSDSLKLLFCIDMLNEGIHVDDIDGVILFRPTVSPIVYKQQIGRALCSGRKNDPIILDIVDNIGGLYCIDSIREEMDNAIERLYSSGESSYVVNDIFHIIDEVRDCRELFGELDKILIPSWDILYNAAAEYYRENGDLNVPSRYYTEEGIALGTWILNLRGIYRGTIRGRLTQEQIIKLEAIGMEWKTLHERQWESGYAKAKEFYEKNGHLKVTKKQKSLYQWIIRQRQKYKSGQLSSDEIEKLTSVGMIWNLEDIWEKGYEAAIKYFAENGNLDIPAAYITSEGLKLGMWYRTTRGLYRKGELSDEKIRRLKNIGYNEISVKIRNWEKKYEIAKRYYEINGDLNVNPAYITDDGVKLGAWVVGQRESYRKNQLNGKQIKMLEEIGISWNRFDTLWQNGYNYAKKYYEEYGNLNCSVDYITADRFRLGAWVHSQRSKHKQNKLSEDKIKQLENIGMVWSVVEATWNMNYEEAKKFYEQNGHLRISPKYVSLSGAKLNSWVSNMRHKCRTNALPLDKAEKLAEIGIV